MAVFVIQQPFSSYTFSKMKVLFGLKADSFDQLPCIEIGSSATPEEIRNSVIEDLLRMRPHPSLAQMRPSAVSLFLQLYLVWRPSSMVL